MIQVDVFSVDEDEESFYYFLVLGMLGDFSFHLLLLNSNSKKAMKTNRKYSCFDDAFLFSKHQRQQKS